MTDVLTPAQRSANMAAIRSGNTKPEMIVRRLVHRMGYRYRLHGKSLPGKPDLVFSARRKVIFVHGCFWHMHHCPFGKVVPATNSGFWDNKRRSNVERDHRTARALRRDGWQVLTIWECWTKTHGQLLRKLEDFLP